MSPGLLLLVLLTEAFADFLYAHVAGDFALYGALVLRRVARAVAGGNASLTVNHRCWLLGEFLYLGLQLGHLLGELLVGLLQFRNGSVALSDESL